MDRQRLQHDYDEALFKAIQWANLANVLSAKDLRSGLPYWNDATTMARRVAIDWANELSFLSHLLNAPDPEPDYYYPDDDKGDDDDGE